MPKSVFIIGGASSGKSTLALDLAGRQEGRKFFMATAQAGDQEMARRIKRHQAERGPDWTTVEEPLALEEALKKYDGPASVLLVDCLTLWLSNLMTNLNLDPADVQKRCEALAGLLPGMKGRVFLVANEVGMGLVPENALARAFREQAGRLNQLAARACEQVILVTAGLPVALKGPSPDIT